MLKALIHEPQWLAQENSKGQPFHLNWLADVEDENGDVIDLHATFGETLLMAAHCVDAAEQAWVWGTWWGDAPDPIPRRGAAGSLCEAQRAAIDAGLQMAEKALRAGGIRTQPPIAMKKTVAIGRQKKDG
jgi:hypothetical protein